MGVAIADTWWLASQCLLDLYVPGNMYVLRFHQPPVADTNLYMHLLL